LGHPIALLFSPSSETSKTLRVCARARELFFFFLSLLLLFARAGFDVFDG
jgi:hypothetical protein